MRTHFSDMNKNISNPSENQFEDQNNITNDIINGPFTYDEIKKHTNALKKNKSPGVDYILNEFIKYCPENLIYVIVNLFNIVLESGVIPSEWTIGIIKVYIKIKVI